MRNVCVHVPNTRTEPRRPFHLRQRSQSGLLSHYTELNQLVKRLGKVFEECILVRGIQFHILSERLLEQGEIGGKHHKLWIILGLELFWAIPVASDPLLLEEKLEASDDK